MDLFFDIIILYLDEMWPSMQSLYSILFSLITPINLPDHPSDIDAIYRGNEMQIPLSLFETLLIVAKTVTTILIALKINLIN